MNLHKSSSSEITESLAEKLGSQLRGSEIIELIGDVGAGKTTFVRGLARGADSVDRVSSPTFTVYQKYTGRITLYHYDFYRIQDDKLVASELLEILDEPNTAVVLEWAEHIQPVLPEDHIVIKISTTGEQSRRLEFTIPPENGYIEL